LIALRLTNKELTMTFTHCSYRHLFLLTLISLTACKSTPTTPVKNQVTDILPINTGKPVIKKIIDLGGLDIPFAAEQLPKHFSDKRFSPGEWILIEGENLGAREFTIDGKVVHADRYYGRHPLIQIPTGLSPVKEHQISINTDFGKTSHPFHTQHYIAATDTDGKTTHLIRTNPDTEGGVEEDWLSLPADADRPMFNLISSDSRFLFSINIDDRAEINHDTEMHSFVMEIITYHLAAPNKPAEIARFKTEIDSTPIDAVINNQNKIILLGKNSLTLVDANNPTHLQHNASFILPKNKERTTFVDAAFVDNGKKIVALETYSNSVVLLDIESPNISVVDRIHLLPTKTIPLSIDIEVNPENSQEFWVLQGSNYRLANKSVIALYNKIVQKKEVLEQEKPVNQLQKLHVNQHKLELSSTLKMDNKYAYYYSTFGQDGRLYLSSTKLEWFLSTQDKAPKNPLAKIGSKVWDTVAIGRIIAVDTQTEKVQTIASGFGIYYHLVDVPDIGPVFTLAKIGPSPLAMMMVQPYWGVGVKSTGTYAKRKMDKHAIFPPYSLGFIAYQY
jgi:hypothetical protein